MSSHTATEPAKQQEISQSKITCPNCSNTRVVDVTKYRGSKGPVKARCICGCVFDVSLKDLRRFYRKRTKLPGSYSRTDRNKTGVITVKDLSFTGLRFDTEKDHDLEVDDIIGIRFMLNDAKKTELRRTVVVRNVRKHSIGAEFSDSHGFDMELCYYLMLS